MTRDDYRIVVKNKGTEIAIKGSKKYVNKTFKNLKPELKREMRRHRKPAEKAEFRSYEKKSKKTKSEKAKTSKPKKIDLKDKTLSEIFKLKNPQKENQRILLMGYYASEVLDKEEFKGKDLKIFYRELGMEVPNTITYHLKRMTDEKGLLDRGGKQGHYRMTDKGIKYIHEEIPSK